MKNLKLFQREFDLIVDEDLRSAVIGYMDEEVPDYFWEEGASSSGKYHPKFSQNTGGLVRHTKAVVMFAEELLRMTPYDSLSDEYKDYVIAACIMHDTKKYGVSGYDKKEYKNHAMNAAIAFNDYCSDCTDYEPHHLMLHAMAAHMGQWSTNPDDRPITRIDDCVHLADYMASRRFIDIPELSYDYWLNVEELPFD